LECLRGRRLWSLTNERNSAAWRSLEHAGWKFYATIGNELAFYTN